MKNSDKRLDTNEQINTFDTQNGEDTAKEQKLNFKNKLDNFLYHYKWHTLIGVGAVLVLIWVVASFFGGTEIDARIGYIGDHPYSALEMRELSDKLSAKLKFDSNGDGKTVIDFESHYYLNDEQLRREAEAAAAKGEEYYFSYLENAKNYEAFEKDIKSRDAAIWFVSPEVYATLDKSKLMPLEDILGYLPEGAVDGYALSCSSLDFTTGQLTQIKYRSYLVMRVEREYSTIMGNDIAMKQLEADIALFREIANYK